MHLPTTQNQLASLQATDAAFAGAQMLGDGCAHDALLTAGQIYQVDGNLDAVLKGPRAEQAADLVTGLPGSGYQLFEPGGFACAALTGDKVDAGDRSACLEG